MNRKISDQGLAKDFIDYVMKNHKSTMFKEAEYTFIREFAGNLEYPTVLPVGGSVKISSDFHSIYKYYMDLGMNSVESFEVSVTITNMPGVIWHLRPGGYDVVIGRHIVSLPVHLVIPLFRW